MGLVDNTLFTKKRNSHIIIVQIYVDDIIFGSTCQELCDDFSKIMHDEFEMSMMGELNFFLGLQIKQLKDGIFFNQSKYVKEMLKKFGLENSKPIKTPMSSETKLTRDEEGDPLATLISWHDLAVLLYLTGQSAPARKSPPPTTPTSQTSIPHLSPTSNNGNLLLTHKSTPLPLSSPPPAPTQPSKLTSPLAINLDPIELLFSTPPTSPQAFLNSLEDLPPATTNPPPPHPSFDTIERLANEPPPIPPIDSSFPSPTPNMEPPIPPFPPQCSPNLPSNVPPLPPLGPNNPFPMLTHIMFCEHCQRTQVIIDNFQGEASLSPIHPKITKTPTKHIRENEVIKEREQGDEGLDPRRQAQDDALRNWEAQIDQLRRQEHEASECKMVRYQESVILLDSDGVRLHSLFVILLDSDWECLPPVFVVPRDESPPVDLTRSRLEKDFRDTETTLKSLPCYSSNTGFRSHSSQRRTARMVVDRFQNPFVDSFAICDRHPERPFSFYEEALLSDSGTQLLSEDTGRGTLLSVGLRIALCAERDLSGPTMRVEGTELWRRLDGGCGMVVLLLYLFAPLSKSTPPVLVPILRRTARMAVRVPHAMSSGLSADLPLRKRYRGTSKLVEDSEEDDDEEDEEIEESMDSDSEEGEEVVPGGQQQAASVVRITVSAPLGLGYGALRRRELALEEGDIHNTFEVRHGSGSAPESERPERTSGLLPISLSHSDVPSPISSPMVPLTVPSPVATPATVETEGFLTKLGAQVKMQGGLIHDHAVRLEELSPALFKRYDMDIGELFNRSKAVRDEIFSQRYRFRSLEYNQERVAVTFGAIWRPMLALEAWAGQTDGQRAALWHAVSDVQRENHDLQLQLTEERHAQLELAEVVDGIRRRREPRG
ncbi:copia protein, partial [Tanacetum coccineum]